MRKYIIISFALIFILYGLGSGVTIYHLVNTTTDLRYLISLHEIEDIRQELSFNLQKIQNYAFSSPAFFASNLDEIIDSANIVDNTVGKCYDCHHDPGVEAELNEVDLLIQEYQEQLSFLITTATEGERRRNHQINVVDQSNIILNHVQGMVNRAARTLNLKTDLAMQKINRSYIILAATLLLTFLAALLVAQYLTKRITRPIKQLLTATNKITEGEMGYQTDYKGREEFKTLIATFNSMSASLARKEKKIQNTMKKLSLLNLMTLPLHAAQDMSIILDYLQSHMNALIAMEHIGIIMPDEDDRNFILHLFHTGPNKKERKQITMASAELLDVYRERGGKSLMDNSCSDKAWPFAEKPAEIKIQKLLIVWMLIKNNVNGALVAINKKENDFLVEDSRILGILANNMSVALENIRLLKNAQLQMIELKNTQRQLIEAEKLTALGTLAGGVAHDFNNILCGMIGYVALLKRNHEPDDKDYQMLDTIEKAGFRAANLTRQLLTFSRQEAMELKGVEVNEHIVNVMKLLENTISKLIRLKLEPGEGLPLVQSDPAQLEQIVMNLAVNARDAMPDGGEILIKSEHAVIDQQFCTEHPEARPGEYIRLSVSDQGEGIDQEILPRIFEPFFTTKEFGKGTGLGLAMVYGIVKSHKGFIIVSSAPKEKTVFNVYLPVAGSTLDEESPAIAADQTMKADVLIVDDEELVASMLAEHLQSLGCHTYFAKNGEEALDILHLNKDAIEVAILDMNMPVMDGREAFEKMMAIKPNLKVLLASGYSQDDAVMEILNKGAHGFIQKPYSLDNIAVKIRQALDQ